MIIMLTLSTSVLSLMMGFLSSTALGLVLIPWLKKINLGQKISIYVADRHSSKSGTPTMGGLIFIIPTIIMMITLFFNGKIELNTNILIVLFVFISYAMIGFLDDFLSIKRKKNAGLTEFQKISLQLLVSMIFYYLFITSGNEPILWISSLNIKINLGWFYGIFILFVLVGTSNAVNLTDGLDGLAGGLATIAFVSFGIISFGAEWIEGYRELAIFCFTLSGAILGFLIFNAHPAKVFMGDTGSLALGAALGAVAILTRYELTLIVIAGVFLIETLSVIIQVFSVVVLKRKVFLMSPLHHHFEKLGWIETDIVRLFWVVGFVLSMAAIGFGVWI